MKVSIPNSINVELDKEEIETLRNASIYIHMIMNNMKDNKCTTIICAEYDTEITYSIDDLRKTANLLADLTCLIRLEI